MSARIVTLPFPLVASSFDEIIDVRSPAEYAEDHVSGAINLPVLNDAEREEVGTLYKQVSPFRAKKLGAAWISKRIAGHLEQHFCEKPKAYRPAVYCWRGGQRSRSLAMVLAEIGWRVIQLEGGYKAYRRHVVEELRSLSERLRFRVLNGLTGSGKTLLLKALCEQGAQVLDLEGLANHKGSLFGGHLVTPQPAQKRFESTIYDTLTGCDPDKVVFVEAESPKIGHLNIPGALMRKMRRSPVTELRVPLKARAAYLHRDYADWLEYPDKVLETLDRLQPYHSREQIEAWRKACHQRQWVPLISEILEQHYDQRYGANGSGHYAVPEAVRELADHSQESIATCAASLL